MRGTVFKMTNKYLRIYLLGLKNIQAYLGELAIILFFPLEMLALFYVWKTVFEAGFLTSQFDLASLITYYVISQLLGYLRPQISGEISNDIVHGHLSRYLVRPIMYFYALVSRVLPYKTFFLVLGLIVVFTINMMFPLSLVITPLSLLLFIVVLMLGFVIDFLFAALLGAIGFWTEKIEGIQRIFYMIRSFLSGAWIPLTLLPGVITSISLVLPFQYVSFFPAMILLGNVSTSAMIDAILIELAWIPVLLVVTSYVWKKGLKRYSGYGA